MKWKRLIFVLAVVTGCGLDQGASLAELESDGLETVMIASPDGSNVTVPSGAIAAVVRHAVAGYRRYGNASMENQSLAHILPGSDVTGVRDIDDFTVRVESGGYSDRTVPVSIYLTGVNPADDPLGETWEHALHYIATLRPDGSWSVTRDPAKPSLVS